MPPNKSVLALRDIIGVRMAKTTKDNTASNKQAKKSTDIANRHLDESYLDLFTLQPRPVNLAWIEKLGVAGLNWAIKNDDALMIGQFFLPQGISSSSWYKWVDKFPTFKEAHEEMMAIIGMRRELGGLGKKLDCGMVSYTAAHYDKRCWKKLAEWRSKLTKDENKTGEIKVVEVPAIPNSLLVKAKEIKVKE
jgi:hypothetical protein